MKGCPFSEFTIEPNASPLHFDQTLGDIQAKTGARHFTRFHIIGTEEFLEDLCLIFDRDPNAIIPHP